jgi:hypothetical protein
MTTATETKHTPGPWKYDPAFGCVVACGTVSMMICDPPAIQHRGPKGELAPAEVEFYAANAYLIAAAPELLEACRTAAELADEAASYLSDTLSDSDEAMAYAEELATLAMNARTAIAKSTAAE